MRSYHPFFVLCWLNFQFSQGFEKFQKALENQIAVKLGSSWSPLVSCSGGFSGASEKKISQQRIPNSLLRNQLQPPSTPWNPPSFHQNPRKPIKIHQNPPESIRFHQNPSESIWTHHNPPEFTRIHQNPLDLIKIHQNPSESIRIHQHPIRIH